MLRPTTTDIKMIHETLIAFYDMAPSEQKIPGEANFELGNWIAKIDNQLKSGRTTYKRTNHNKKKIWQIKT